MPDAPEAKAAEEIAKNIREIIAGIFGEQDNADAGEEEFMIGHFAKIIARANAAHYLPLLEDAIIRYGQLEKIVHEKRIEREKDGGTRAGAPYWSLLHSLEEEVKALSVEYGRLKRGINYGRL